MKDQPIPVFYDSGSAASTQYREAISGIRGAAQRAGEKITLISEAEDYAWANAPDVSIIASDSMPYISRILAELRRLKKRAVLAALDADQFGAGVSCATPSRREETQQMVNYLYQIGCRRFALVGYGLNSINDNFRFHAVMSALAALGIEPGGQDVWRWTDDPQSCIDAFLRASPQCDAVICPNDTFSVLLINGCRGCGIRVPEDLYVASFGNTNIGRYYSPSITTMTMDMPEVGRQTFSVWQFQSSQPFNDASVKITVPGRLLIRESTANRLPDGAVSPVNYSMEVDPWYFSDVPEPLTRLENCLSTRDDIDMRLLARLMDGQSYEAIAGALFISDGTLRYRLNKICQSLELRGRAALTDFLRTQLRSENPFAEWIQR